MLVLVADNFEQSGLDGLKAAGCGLVYQPDLKDDALTAAIRDTAADVLVVRSTAVTAPMLEAGALSLVVRAGAGYNTIDIATASTRGIYVSNCPGKNAIAVAELAFALLLTLDRRVPDNVAELRAGRWNKKEYSKARGLFGRTIGLLGYGSIGQEMAKRAHAFGMAIVVWSRRFASGAADVAAQGVPMQFARTPEEVAERSDILSVHVALTPDTRGLVNEAVLEKLRPRSLFINTARAEVVDYAALEKAVRERGIRVGLDVFAGEPSVATGEFKPPIVSLPNVYGTHHIGASTDQAQEAIAAETVRIVISYKDTGKVPNVVNLSKKTPATHLLVVRHRDRPGVLAHVFEHLRAGDINVQETENVIFEGAQAAVARINLDGAPSEALLKVIQEGNGDILDLHLVRIFRSAAETVMPTVHRVHNFAAGPAVLPVPVLEEIQRDLIVLPGVGMSILEISHRSAPFEAILAQAEADIRSLASIPSNYRVLFLQGGASLQFSMVPMNLLTPEATADYIDSGSWAEKAVKEAKRVGIVNVAASTKSENYTRVPTQSELKLTPGAAYVHVTSNNTIEGTECRELPEVGDVPLVSDTSSDMFSRPIDVTRHALIYSGAQKNMGPAGVTVVIVRDDLLQRSPTSLPTMLNYAVHAENGSLYNTPPAFAVYAMGLVMKWLIRQGGLTAIAKVNERKAGKLYAEIDRTGFYRGTAQKESRSLMNVTFRLATEELEKQFVKEATAAGLDGLKGHRSVGGMRASIYNAFPEEGVDALVDFMKAFERARG